MKFKYYRPYPIVGRLVRPPAPTEMTPQELTKYDGTQDTPDGYAIPPIYVGIKNKVKLLCR